MNAVKTPCIGICSTTSFGDSICRGCKRFNFEVIGWHRYSEEEKRAVMSRIDQLTTQIMSRYFQMHSVATLEQALDDYRFFYDPALSPWIWLHNLLQKRFSRIQSLQELGVSIHPDYAGTDIRDVLLKVNSELHTLSEAHFERYFQQNQR